jgi:signal transduction histidine kinase
VLPQLGDWCLIDQVEGQQVVKELAAAHADTTQLDLGRGPGQKEQIELSGNTGIARVLLTGRPELLAEIPDAAWMAEAIAADDAARVQALGASSALFVPLSARQRTLGVMTLVSSGSRRFGASDLALAEEVCRRLALAMDNALFYEEAHRSRRAREQLLAVVSHDLRNPLGTILVGASYLERISREVEHGGPIRKSARIIQRSAERMKSLIGDLMDLAQIHAGGLAVERETNNAAEIIHDSLEILKPLAASKGLHLDGSARADLEVSCDRDRVMQILSNLVGNAIKFTLPGGSISIRAQAIGPEARFEVADTGPGIPKAQLAHIWERFWQGQSKSESGGIGLGLTIAKGLVDAHGGRIWAESEPGVGTTFFFTLPLASEEHAQASSRDQSELPSSRL